jgi:signal transduction histidine kinase
VAAKRSYLSASWLFVGAMFVLCGILGVLQYRWIGDVSVAERDRLQHSLEADLIRLSQDFNSELTSACRALLFPVPAQDVSLTPKELSTRYAQWRKSTRHPQLFQAVALATPRDNQLVLTRLNLESGSTQEEAWPENWKTIENRLQARLSPEAWRPHGGPGYRNETESHLFEIPVFRMDAPADRTRHGNPRGRFARVETGWLVLDLNARYLSEVLLPELVQRHIGTAGGGLDYEVAVVSKTNPPATVYQTSANALAEIAGQADASVGLFDVQMDQLFPRPEPPGMHNPFVTPAFRVGPDMGRWEMRVRNRAGSLEAVVSKTRRRSMAVTGAILLLLVATAGALLRYTRRAQRLARLQMDFVAGVSHELRTPLAVIYGAAYNLRGTVAQNPSQVEKYGVLLQHESGRLRDLVEQVLRFSSAEAGNVIREREPISIHDLIEKTVDGSKTLIQSAQCVIEKHIDPELPIVLGDPIALKQALQNLVSNAAKYGQNKNNGGNWIGVTAAARPSAANPAVEIRVADHGPGIPDDEQEHVFDAFFRGRRAIQDQIHGTGLGLNLVKKIVEAHGGSIRVESEPMKRTEFIIRLPAAATAGTCE